MMGKGSIKLQPGHALGVSEEVAKGWAGSETLSDGI
jgi:hypothetical protein